MATLFGSLPYILQNGTVADASQVMADFNKIIGDGNANVAANGTNSDITALLGLTTPIPAASGGTTKYVGGTSTGTANAQAIATVVPAGLTNAAGVTLVFTPGLTNTGPTTLNANGQGVINIMRRTPAGPTALVGGELILNQEATVTCDGTQWLLDTAGNVLTPSVFTDSGTVELTGVLSPAALASGLTNDYAPTGLAAATILRLSGNASGSVLTGILARNAGTFLILQNISANPILLLPNSTSSLAANRFAFSAPVSLTQNQSMLLWYDATTGSWRQAQNATAAPTGSARKNLKIVATSNTASTITADELVLEDTLGATYRALSVAVSYATGTSGAGGLDTGTITASNWYFEYVIYNSLTNTISSLLSLSATAPTMPSGYTFKARVGAIYYDSGSKLRWKVQYDRKVRYVIGTNPTSSVIIDSGVKGTFSTTSPVLLPVLLTAYAPSTAASIDIAAANKYAAGGTANVIVAPSSAWGGTNNGPQGSNGNIYPIYIYGTGGPNNDQFATIVLEALSIAWASDATGGAISIFGYDDNL